MIEHYLKKRRQADVIYTDFEKVFDKVLHNRLISELSSYGIDEAIVK